MSVVPESESALEFLATCAARLVTTWDTTTSDVPLGGPLTLYFQSGEITSATGEWKGTLTVAGKLKLTKTDARDKGSTLVLRGTYDRAHNAVDGECTGHGSHAAHTGKSFHMGLQVPDIVMTVEQEEATRAHQRSEAVSDYNKQREAAMAADLGAAGTDILTTWTALYVYGSGRSDTVKDILIRAVAKGSSGDADLSGSGSDSQGDYTWTGTLQGDKFTLVKQYLGAHAIAHSGTYNRSSGTVKGNWSIAGTRASGGFQMSESVGRRVNGAAMGDASGSSSASSSSSSSGSLAAQDGVLTDASVADTVWSVVYVYASGRSDELKDCTLRLVRGCISGSGEDSLGSFRWSGSLSSDGSVVVDKEYIGQHTVRHTGTVSMGPDGCVAKGSWSVPNTRAVGGFRMTERTNMRRGVPKVFTQPLGSTDQPVVVTMDIDYAYGSGDSEEARGIRLRLDGSSVSGRGADGVGECEWRGEIKEGKGMTVVTKHYPGKHDIVHRGTYDAGRGRVTGDWEIPGTEVSGSFTMEERLVERRLPKGATASSRSAHDDHDHALSKGGARGVAVPSMETAQLGSAKSLPPLHQIKDEVVTVWKGHQIIGSSETTHLDLKVSFTPANGGIEISGKGSDEAGGDYTVTGSLNPSTLAVNMTKKYKTHTMDFTCTYSPEDSSIKGKWAMSMMKATGHVELMEVPEKRLG